MLLLGTSLFALGLHACLLPLNFFMQHLHVSTRFFFKEMTTTVATLNTPALTKYSQESQ